MTRDSEKPIEILLIEDNQGDVQLFNMLLRGTKIRYQITVLKDGQTASEYLFDSVKKLEVPRPDLIVLDLNLPRKDGREILKDCKQDADLGGIPILVLTTSSDQRDIARCYELHANCYVTKPSDLTRFNMIMKSIEEFWFNTAEIPQFKPLRGGG